MQEKIVDIISHQGSTNKTHKGIPLHTHCGSTHTPMWLESKGQIITTIGKDVDKAKLLLLVETWTGIAIFASCWQCLKKLSIISVWASNSTPRELSSNKSKNICPYKTFYTNCNELWVIATSWKQSKMSSNEQILKTWYVHAMKYYVAIKVMKYWSMWQLDTPWKCYATWK